MVKNKKDELSVSRIYILPEIVIGTLYLDIGNTYVV